MTDAPLYTWIDRAQMPYFDPLLQQSYDAVRCRVIWTATGQPLTVWVPLTKYTPDYVNAQIAAAGAKDDAMAELGAAPAA